MPGGDGELADEGWSEGCWKVEEEESGPRRLPGERLGSFKVKHHQSHASRLAQRPPQKRERLARRLRSYDGGPKPAKAGQLEYREYK